MPSREDKKRVIPSAFGGITLPTRHYSIPGIMAISTIDLHEPRPNGAKRFNLVRLAEGLWCGTMERMNGQLEKPHQSLFRTLLPQMILFGFLATLYLLSLLKLIPSPHELNDLLLKLFKDYGLPIIAVSSFVENLIGVNAYFPGAFTILTGMSLTAGHPSQAVVTYLAIYVPAYAANVLSFFSGKWQKGDVQNLTHPVSKRAWSWFFLTYWHPQLAAITAFSGGVRSQVSTKHFFVISFVVSLFWSLFWAIIIYHFGLMAKVADYFGLLFIAYLLIWTSTDTWKYFRKCPAG
jgi:membrane protein DedA with SNARE-associated domain